jgi:hypothetical protein
MMTRYSHLSQIDVVYGRHVEKGERIGLSGGTGEVTGDHLDVALKEEGVSNPQFKDWLDPLPYLRRNTMSKLSPHFQKIPDWAKPLWANCKNEWYKVVLPPIGDPFPGKKGIGRPWIGGDNVENTYIRDGAAGAESYFARLRQYYLDRPYIWAWEGPNEPQPMGDPAFRHVLNLFETRWIELMHSIQKRAVALSLSVGWPDKPEHILDFRFALGIADYWTLHEYSAPTMQDAAGWHCLRYRQTVQALKDSGYRVPPLLITECGIDGGVLSPPQPKTGWKTHARDAEDFMGQLSWYDRELCQDDYVKAAFIFTSGPESEWMDFDANEALTRKLVNHINSSSPLPVAPPPASDSLTNEERARLRGFFAARVPATLKDAIARQRVFIGEVPETPNLYIAWDPAYGRYEICKLDAQTWELLDSEPL